jgi:hypothetical protein
MPTFFPHNGDVRQAQRAAANRMGWTRVLLVTLMALGLVGMAAAQTLARPGWAGSGLAPETWYQHAIFYRIDAPSDIPSRVQLPSLQAFGIDGILLSAADLPTQAAAPTVPATDAPLTIDDLLFECSRLHIRVFVPLDINRKDVDLLALAKSWLYRGAAGFVLPAAAAAQLPAEAPRASNDVEARGASTVHSIHLAKPAAEAPIVAALHALLARFPGDRMLIADGAPLTVSIQLQLVTLTQTPTAPQAAARALLSLAPGTRLTPVEAARLLVTPYPGLIDSSALPPTLLVRVFPPLSAPLEPVVTPKPEPAPPPPANVYGAFKPYVRQDLAAERRAEAAQKKIQEEADRISADTFPVQPTYESIGATPEAHVAFYHRLVQLHRAKTSRAGSSLVALEAAAPAFAWSITHAGAEPVVIVCNPAGAQQSVNLSPWTYFRTLVHTAASSGVVNANTVGVGPQGVYVGQAIERR